MKNVSLFRYFFFYTRDAANYNYFFLLTEFMLGTRNNSKCQAILLSDLYKLNGQGGKKEPRKYYTRIPL